MITDDRASDPFFDLDAFLDLPKVTGLWLSPDGSRLVAGVSSPDRERTRYTTALWEVDPAGERPARRLTHSSRGETFAAFTPSGDLLFVSARPDPDGDDARPALWLQPAGGGDARVIVALPGGVYGVVVSKSGTIVFGTAMMPSATDLASDLELRARRDEAKVSAILHEEFPVRFWDHDLGPARTRLVVAELTGDVARLEPRDLTGHAGRALDDECTWDITPDGRTVVAMWSVAEPGGSQRHTLVAIDVATGERHTLADDPRFEYDSPRVSPDGTRVAAGVCERFTQHDPGDRRVGILELAGGEIQAPATVWDRWPHSPRWTPDGTALIVIADDHGRKPLWRMDATSGQPTRLTQDGAFTDVQIAPDGRWAYALRSAVDSQPTAVRIGLDGTPSIEPLPSPGAALEIPGRLAEVTTITADGTEVRGWLALPHHASADTPAPLLLWVHGGPVMALGAWAWRWNPWLAVAKGYAVLLPDFALSTGYGLDFIRRGWGQWGGTPYTDLMSITDAAQERADIDPARAAALGGSFGGYMTNWIAGHTSRFAAIVSHASIWSIRESSETADISHFFRDEMTAEAADVNSPHHFADAITTPMLVIHGDRDYRVPISEAMRLWWNLSSRSKAAMDGQTPHKFLYFPDENHFILAPEHLKIWYSTVFAFLDHHVRGEDWRRPDLLG